MEQKVLIVDDNRTNQKILEDILKDDFKLEKTESGEKALEIIPVFKPDIVLLDVMMPGLDGYSVCEMIKKSGKKSNTKVLLVSAKVMLEDRLKGYNVGADDYITKPFDEEELLAKVKVFARLNEEEMKRKKAEEDVRRNETKFRSIFSNANDAILLVDENGHYKDCNDVGLKMFGCKREEMIGRSFLDFSPLFQPDGNSSSEKMKIQIKNAYENNPSHFEWQYQRSNRSTFFAEISLSILHLDKEQNLLAIVRDISERKKFEAKIRSANEEMQALSETGALVATVAHDAKKFTSAMSMSLEGLIIPCLREKLDQSEHWVMNLMNDVLEVHSNSNQCTHFLESLLAINRKTEVIEPVSSVDIIQRAFGLLSYNLIQDKVEWHLEYQSGRKMMVMGNNQLIRVFMNLIANASDALKKFEVAKPKISVTIEEDDKTVIVSVHDNGPGIKKDILEVIRKGMVVSTKGKGGNGFGVSGATKIVKNCNGTMEIESELGRGATFIVNLPKANEEVREEVNLEGVDLF